jgi:phosphoglycolate phosphatase
MSSPLPTRFADIDGTLVHAVGKDANRLHKEAFSSAFMEKFSIETHIDVVDHHGHTDPLVLVKVLTEAHGCNKEEVMSKLPELEAHMINYFNSSKSRSACACSDSSVRALVRRR